MSYWERESVRHADGRIITCCEHGHFLRESNKSGALVWCIERKCDWQFVDKIAMKKEQLWGMQFRYRAHLVIVGAMLMMHLSTLLCPGLLAKTWRKPDGNLCKCCQVSTFKFSIICKQ